jgi:hypothetical protein
VVARRRLVQAHLLDHLDKPVQRLSGPVHAAVAPPAAAGRPCASGPRARWSSRLPPAGSEGHPQLVA